MHQPSRLLTAALAALALAACGRPGSSSTLNASVTAQVLSDTVAAASDATGTMLCAPSQAQIDACATLAAGDACSLTSADGLVSVAGTCRETLDGITLACGHNPPAPPAPLVEACASKAAGDACSVVEPDGDSHAGLCVTARDGVTLVCGRQHVPPQVAIDACATLVAGDACTLARADGSTMSGTCSLGPAGTGVLACTMAQALRPSATTACAGLAAGAACAIGSMRHPVAGTCVTPAAGGDPVCQAACAAFGGPFRYQAGPHGGGMGPGTPPPPPPAPPPAAVEACAALAAADACSFVNAAGVTVDGTCRAAPDATGTLVCAPAMTPGPVPPPPPAAAVEACTGLAAGAACTVTRLDGGTAAGTCRLAADGATLACVPTMMSPPPGMGPRH